MRNFIRTKVLWKSPFILQCVVMEKTAKRSRLAGVPAWALSVLTLVVTFAYLVIISGLDMSRELADQPKISVGSFRLSVLLDFFIFFHNYNMNQSVWLSLSIIMMITVPFIVVGMLFILSHFRKRNHRKVKALIKGRRETNRDKETFSF